MFKTLLTTKMHFNFLEIRIIGIFFMTTTRFDHVASDLEANMSDFPLST